MNITYILLDGVFYESMPKSGHMLYCALTSDRNEQLWNIVGSKYWNRDVSTPGNIIAEMILLKSYKHTDAVIIKRVESDVYIIHKSGCFIMFHSKVCMNYRNGEYIDKSISCYTQRTNYVYHDEKIYRIRLVDGSVECVLANGIGKYLLGINFFVLDDFNVNRIYLTHIGVCKSFSHRKLFREDKLIVCICVRCCFISLFSFSV